MSKFKEYLEAVKVVEKEPIITISDTNHNELKKTQDKDLLNPYGFNKESWENEGKWEWPENVKTRWFNADYSTEINNANFQPEYWMPILNNVFNDEKRKEYGIHTEQLFKYQKPVKMTGVRDAAYKGQALGRGFGDRKGSNIKWLKNLSEQDIRALKGYDEKKIQKLSYKTKNVSDAVLTFYGSPQDLIELLF